MNPNATQETTTAPPEQWRIVVNSIDRANAGLIPALKHIAPYAENRLASVLYQAPAELLNQLPRESAEAINTVLTDAGLDSEIVDAEYTFTPGDRDHEIALVINEGAQISKAVGLVMQLLGIDFPTARKMVIASPAMLMSNISANTVEVLRERFEKLGIGVDVSRPAEALYDIFIGQCTANDLMQIKRHLAACNIPLAPQPTDGSPQPLLAVGLEKKQADQAWSRLQRTNYPARIINRDFQRFDLLLEAAPETPEMIALLVESTGMPERIAHKAVRSVQKAPLALHRNIDFPTVELHLQRIAALGGRAVGDLLLFKTFALRIDKVGRTADSLNLLCNIGGLTTEAARAALRPGAEIPGPLTSHQALWLCAELKGVETVTRLLRNE